MNVMQAWRVILGVAAALALAPRVGAAELRWQAPVSCPDLGELRFRIERAIGMPLGHAAPLDVRVTVARERDGFAAQLLSLADASQAPRQRTLQAPDCAALVDLVVVTVALALGAGPDPEPRVDGATGSAAPRAAPARPLVSAPALRTGLPGPHRAETPSAATRSEPLGAAWQPALSLSLLGDTGSLPRAGAGVALGARLERSQVQVRALASALLEQHRELGSVGAAQPGADLRLVAAALSACVSPLEARAQALELAGCAGWELGRLSGSGTGVVSPREGGAWWSAPRADLEASWPLGGSELELSAGVTLLVPLARQEFVLSELGSVHRPPAAVGRAALGLNWSPR